MNKLVNLQKLSLTGNPFHCDCQMAWIKQFENPPGETIIADYQNLTCTKSSKKLKLADYLQTECFPQKWLLPVSISSGVVVVAIIAGVMVIKLNFRVKFKVKYFMYYHMGADTIPKDDKTENLENILYDGFFCFR